MPVSDNPADRKALRTLLRDRRKSLSPADRLRAANGVAAQLFELPFMPSRGYVAGYWAMDGELALHAFQLSLPPDVVYCLPVLHDNNELRFAPFRPGDAITHNRFGIPEPTYESLLSPQDMSLVIMPLVGFAADGQRLGMGGGWYDRSFAFRSHGKAPPWLVGVGYDEQEFSASALTPQPWDVMPDAICTPTRRLSQLTEHA